VGCWLTTDGCVQNVLYTRLGTVANENGSCLYTVTQPHRLLLGPINTFTTLSTRTFMKLHTLRLCFTITAGLRPDPGRSVRSISKKCL
jgi:hypothetical protein